MTPALPSSQDPLMTLAPTPPTEVKAAVERLSLLRQLLCSAAFIRDAVRAVYGPEAHAETQIPFDIRDVLTALSQLTEENERLRASYTDAMEKWSADVAEFGPYKDRATKAEAEGDEALEALSALLERCRAHGGLSRQGYAERKAMDDAAALLSRSAQGGEHG